MSRFVEVEIRRDGREISGLGERTRFLIAGPDESLSPGDTLRFSIDPTITEPTVIELRFAGLVET